jgi:hypothetical protein
VKITSPINGENNSPYLLRMSCSVERPRIALKTGCLRLIPLAKSIKKRFVQNKIFDGSIFEIIETDELLRAFDSQTRVVQDN